MLKHALIALAIATAAVSATVNTANACDTCGGHNVRVATTSSNCIRLYAGRVSMTSLALPSYCTVVRHEFCSTPCVATVSRTSRSRHACTITSETGSSNWVCDASQVTFVPSATVRLYNVNVYYRNTRTDRIHVVPCGVIYCNGIAIPCIDPDEEDIDWDK